MIKKAIPLSILLILYSSQLLAADLEPAVLQNAQLSPGINLSGYFDGDIQRPVQQDDIRRIKQQGFRSIRLPVCWTKHIEGDQIEPRFLASIRQVVGWCLDEDLRVIVNVHHFQQMNDDPDLYEEFLIALWRMLTVKFSDIDNRLLFELLNEPENALDVDRWNLTIERLHSAIRLLDNNRTLVIGSAEYNGWWTLDRLKLPKDDRNIIVSVHYYSPMKFTHQGAEWMEDRKNDPPTNWVNKDIVLKEFNAIREYATRTGRPINIGEFGVYRRIAPAAQVKAWVGTTVTLCKDANFSFHYWEYNQGFGLYRNGRWDSEITDLLVK